MNNDTTIEEALHDPVLGPEIQRICAEQLAAIINAVHPVVQGWNILELMELQAECQVSSINDIPLTALMRRHRAKQAALKPKRGAPRALTSEQERKVLELVQKGMSYEHIAEEMDTSVATIKRTVRRAERGEF